MDGEGEYLGKDAQGKDYTFWRASGKLDVPLELATKLEKEIPQRFEVINKEEIKELKVDNPSIAQKVEEEIKKNVQSISLKVLKDMTKDKLNDWAAKNDYDVNPSKQKKDEMIGSLINQIEKRTGKKPEQRLKITRPTLCTQAQVLQTAGFNTVDEVGGSDVVTEAIEEAEAEVAGDFGDPIRRSTFVLDNTQTDYEWRNDNQETYTIQRVIVYIDDNSRREYTDGTASETNQEYTKDLEFNKITFHADTVAAYSGNRVQIDYVPTSFHHLVRLKAALFLIDQTNVTNSEEGTPAASIRLMNRINRIEKAITSVKVAGSEDEKYYDPTYGEVIPQRRFWTYS